ncbi:co-chaperone GroES [Candidatus Uhrbacteria bacterium RIFCSPHIGHO2_02_FULL_47_44]|uniref:Co-chaperonin GroES n=1 Tax=Candidatus Uhrbacteria bacterium RIFCSPLOWO2_02_FULL_48_18 TaxID=1802408 RepID=A0A1F7V6N5_9BACT|nr:MAG: co-chaperone GroES [Candidatus Uhrbacteria bacterium RIFCSPHIGHO2_01_FULL_47_10]OGL69982.1 MAG: co-chaperone GroES [Candidatus Uhrbacteria bacterium RIFCSPHIGHO2_02_FULL_47_44]OGL76067.1 MAG: co-chaperone GroES [Candidatus Uhrbacteria bacterium RIFCSPHIGHO2_12_FULL_47_12]OGL80347.1 MAG: co-chaperone GroES [Candidatus Uhrbacteria bacterium RIFCSPLOWO2_01_FULL_47_17]OGL86206.1 MAG: co-chaperone GroES [Candidatus Uhrbacteria bacterium RIFCSPLOWO2_02_FULL_48_18]OGL93377.1 MAG: co-chaperone
MKLTPINDHLIVKAVKAVQTTASGIIIPDTADKERPERGEVIAVGPGRELENGNRSSMPVAVGQIVLFKKYAPDEIKVEGEEFLVITLSDVMAIVE